MLESKLPALGTTIFSRMSALAAQHEALNLSQGCPDFDAPEALREALCRHTMAGHNQYAPLAGTPQLREQVAAQFAPDFAPMRLSQSALLHGHCHQKALVGTGPARRALSLPPGYTVEEVDSGCCGMAGSFGYEAEHYAISMQMGERRLLPAVRAAATGTIIAAAGVSCREQIAQGSGRTALHPAQILRDALRQDFRG